MMRRTNQRSAVSIAERKVESETSLVGTFRTNTSIGSTGSSSVLMAGATVVVSAAFDDVEKLGGVRDTLIGEMVKAGLSGRTVLVVAGAVVNTGIVAVTTVVVVVAASGTFVVIGHLPSPGLQSVDPTHAAPFLFDGVSS